MSPQLAIMPRELRISTQKFSQTLHFCIEAADAEALLATEASRTGELHQASSRAQKLLSVQQSQVTHLEKEVAVKQKKMEEMRCWCVTET